MILRDLLRVLGSSDRREGRNLTYDESFHAFTSILKGEPSEICIASFFIALRWKGITVEELTGFATAARESADIPGAGMSGLVCVAPPLDGYEASPPLEVVSGLVAAACGAKVLLITDRLVPPLRGLTAASLLEVMCADMCWSTAAANDMLEHVGFAAICASGMLPALLGLRAVRGEMGVRTPLSTVEKLIAPSSAAVVLGAQHGPVLGTAVETMASLGHPSGIAIQGIAGGVTPNLKKRTRGIELSGRNQVPLTVEPADFGLQLPDNPDLPMYGPPDEGKGSADNPHLVRAAADMCDGVLKGDMGPARNATLLGTAVILKAVGRVMTLAEGVDAAASAIESGAAQGMLERVRAHRKS